MDVNLNQFGMKNLKESKTIEMKKRRRNKKKKKTTLYFIITKITF